MTIYKNNPIEKKSEKDTEPLTGLAEIDDLETATAPKSLRVTYNPRRARTMVNLCLIFAAILVIGMGLIGGVYLYKHLAGRVVQGRCGVSFYDEIHGESQDLMMGEASNPQSENLRYFEEEIEVSEIDQYETLKVPEFDECEETVVWHDFGMNYTAIMDNHLHACYIMDLNRTLIAPPKDLIDLVKKFKNGYYMPRAKVIRAKYRQVLPPVADITKFGSFIMRECYWYDTYRLVRMVDGVYKRSVDEEVKEKKTHVYGYSTFKNAVLKVTVETQE